ncbi:uncharacterized protein LOC133899394 isoform X2 [Phragmites australis]|uniref:uncharacterized protein LOC133899394 isoform X2 n=1 Tax=Phragmites australis TaxID=29695 RepID=UPI002D78B6BC|nr:uncharacterized protein LOC133899394 isoform X2 [Phragmites australis]
MDPAPDPLSISASAPFPTIPTTSPRTRAARPRRHAAPFRSDHPAAAAAASASASAGRRSGGDLSRRPAAFGFALEEGSPSVGSWGASRDANFVFGSGVAGAAEMRKSFSSGSGGEASLSGLSPTVEDLVLDGSGRQIDTDVSGGDDPVPAMNASGSFGGRGSNSSLHEGFCPEPLDDQTEQLDKGYGVPSQCEGMGTSSLATQAVNSSPCSVENVSIEFPESGDSSPVGNSLDDSLANDGSKLCANGGDGQQNFFVFGEHAQKREFTTNATDANTTDANISMVVSADNESVAYSSEQLNVWGAKGSTCTKFILQDATHAWCSSNKGPPHSEPREISDAVKASDAVPSNFGSEDGSANVSLIKLPYVIEAAVASELAECGPFDEKCFTVHDHNEASRNKGGVKGMSTNRKTVRPKKFSTVRQVSSLEPVSRGDHCSGEVALEKELNLKEAGSFTLESSGINCAKEQSDSNNSASQTTESSLDGTEFTSPVNMEHSGESDFIFAASTFDQSTLHSQRRHNKKNGQGMGSHANSILSLPTSAVGLAQSEVSTSQQCTNLSAQWTKYSKVEPKMATVSGGATCTKIENFGHQEDCETWRLRGNQAYVEGQLTKAEECYTHGIDSFSPNEASRKALMLCYSNRAATRMSLGKMREALSDCREATDIDSSFLKAQVRAANCLLALGDVEEAQKGFEMCLKSNHASSFDHRIAEEASDGLQKAQKVSGFILQSKEYLTKKAFDKIPSTLEMISDALSISIYSDNLMVMKAEALLLLRRYEEVIRFCEETLYQAERNSVCLCPDKHSKSKYLDNGSCSVKLWRYHLIAKSYFFLGKLEEAHQFLKKCGKHSQQSISTFSVAISELLQLKAAGNEAFQAGKYSEAVEHYTTALLSNTESLRFSAICFCNRAATYQAMGQILDAIADCSLAIALDTDYSKAISRRSSLYELIRDYGQAANDLRRLISLLEKQLQENISMPSEKTESIRSNLNRANLRFSSVERDARKGASLNMYLILGIEPSCSVVDIKKAYRKAALKHHPDKAGKFLVRSENISDALWREITNEIHRDADYLFKLIGKAYDMLSDPTMKRK